MQRRTVVHVVGSRRHEEILHTLSRMHESLTLTAELRGVELDADPGNPELNRRFGVILHTLANVDRKRTHFAQTGEMLDDDPLPPNLTAPVDVTVYYHCPVCKDRRHVRVDVYFATPHFGHAIPCPRCHTTAWKDYVEKYGVPREMAQTGGAWT